MLTLSSPIVVQIFSRSHFSLIFYYYFFNIKSKEIFVVIVAL